MIAILNSDAMEALAKINQRAVSVVSEFGPGYLNPFIGSTKAETFDQLGKGMQLLNDLLSGGANLEETRPGLTLFVRAMWSAAQFERDAEDATETVSPSTM